MATSEPETAPRQRLERALQDSLDDPAAAGRLGCLLAGRARFEALVGAAPGGSLAELPPPFDGVDLPSEARDVLEEFRADLGEARAEGSGIAAGYEATLDAADRDAHGQYFTPEPVADALVSWALDGQRDAEEPPRLLDPAVGTGTFLRSALEQLRSAYPHRQPASLLEQLVGVDVDGIALQLTALGLAAAVDRPAPDSLRLRHGSFLDCEPADGELDGTAGSLPTVDAVVGNPPFVRAAAIEPGIEHYRRHLAAFGGAGETPWLDGDDALSRRSDAYVYFVTQATRFLRPGGRLALVLPTKWLMSAYGEDLRRFLRERYLVHAVVGFDGRAFGDALIDTALLLAERDPHADASAPMRFVRLEGATAADRMLAAVAGRGTGTPTVTRPQPSLTASGSLARYLEAPADLLALLDGPPFVRLDALADVARGTMTGANRFFFVDAADIERFGIEDRFRRPAVKSLRSVDRPSVERSDVGRWLVDVHPLVEAIGADIEDSTALERAVKDALRDRGYDGLRRYIEHAEAEGWHEGRTCQSRPVWFDLGALRAPAAFVPKLLRERVYAVRNAAAAVSSNAIDGVWPAGGVQTGALLAALNASVGKAAMEVTGRNEAGLLQLMTYETASLPTLDVRTLSPAAASALASAGDAYAADPRESTRRALDRAVDDAFDLPMAPEELRSLAAELGRTRVDGGETVAVPVG